MRAIAGDYGLHDSTALVVDDFDDELLDEPNSSSFILRKNSQPFKFTKTRIPVNMMQEFMNEGIAYDSHGPIQANKMRQNIKVATSQTVKRRSINVSPVAVGQTKIPLGLYRQITHAHKESSPSVNMSLQSPNSMFKSLILNSDIKVISPETVSFRKEREFSPRAITQLGMTATNNHFQSYFHQSIRSQSPSLKGGNSMLLNVISKDNIREKFNRAEAITMAQHQFYQIQGARKQKLHPQKVDLNNLDVDQTITDEIASKLYDARCIDNDVQPTDNQRESFIQFIRQKCIDGRLLLSDFALGYKCAELLCSILMDPEFYISYLDLRKNPIGDDGMIVLMHAVKRSQSLIYLDISSCNITHVGATRLLRSLRSNECLQHLVLSNTEGQLKNQFGFRVLENLVPLFQQNCFIQFLDLSNNRIQDSGIKLLHKALDGNATISYLNLEYCDISAKSDEELGRMLAGMKVLSDLNISRNKIGDRGVMFLSHALIHNAASQLWRLNIASCEIKGKGTKKILQDLRHNKKLMTLILDNNEFDDDTLATVFLEAFSMNKHLNKLSMSNCELHDGRIQHIFDALSVNKTLQYLVLSMNKLTSKAMFKFRETFEEQGKPLSLRHLDLSSNQIDDDGGVALIQAIYQKDCIESLNLRNNLVNKQTAFALCQYVDTRGLRLTKIDLSMNRAIPKRIIEELNFSIQRNSERTDRIKDSFMKMFRNICRKQDMAAELIEAQDQRRTVLKKIMAAKEKNSQKELELFQIKQEATVAEETLEMMKARLDREQIDKAQEIDQLGVQHDQIEKQMIQQIELQQRKLDDVRLENAKTLEQKLLIDRNIMVHPKSRKKEIIQLQGELKACMSIELELEAIIAQQLDEISKIHENVSPDHLSPMSKHHTSKHGGSHKKKKKTTHEQ